MVKATWNGVVIAESEKTVMVEGNHYFPPESVNRSALADSETTTVCGWKGDASYYSIKAGGETNEDAAWVYRTPKDEAAQIKDHVAFWKGVEIEE